MLRAKERYAGLDASEAISLRDQAQDWLEHGKLAPDPVNYLVAYEYRLGKDPDLVREMNQHVERGNVWDDELLANLFDRLIESRRDERYSGMSDELMSMLGEMREAVDQAHHGVDDYEHTLSRQLGELAGQPGQDKLRAVTSELMSATRLAAESTRYLQGQLDATRDEVDSLREQLEAIRHEADYDALTGALNRKAMNRVLENLAREANRAGRSFCMLVLDVDHFKRFNDTYGHVLGDEVLRRVVQVVERELEDGASVARYGGEEFMVMLPGQTLDAALQVAESIRVAVEQIVLMRRSTGERLSAITVSLGVGVYRPGETAIEMIERVDAALYRAKHAGRNQVISAE